MYDYRHMFDLEGRKALVIGAGSGIGQASAVALAVYGAYVYCGDVNDAGNQETLAQLQVQGGRGEALHLDLLDPLSVAGAAERLGVVDVLVITPGVNVRKPLLQIQEEEFDRIVQLNLKGAFRAIKAFTPGMAAQGRGSIIVFSSIRSQVVEPGQGVYAATKAGVVQMIRALAAELGPHGVRANAIAPGVVETPLTAQIKNHPDWYNAYARKNALGRWAQPHEIAGMVVYLASDASSYVTGALMFVDGGWTAVDGRFDPPL